MKKLLTTLAALGITLGVASNAQANNWLTGSAQLSYYSMGVTTQCTVDTSATQNVYWVDHLGVASNSTIAEAEAYHAARNDGANISAAGLCWLHWFRSLDGDMVANQVESFLGFNPATVMDIDDDTNELIFYLTLDYSNFIPIPGSFLTLLKPDLRSEFQASWMVATNVTNAYRGAPDMVTRGDEDVSYVNAWISDWDAIVAAWDVDESPLNQLNSAEAHAAEITEYFY